MGSFSDGGQERYLEVTPEAAATCLCPREDFSILGPVRPIVNPWGNLIGSESRSSQLLSAHPTLNRRPLMRLRTPAPSCRLDEP